MVGAASFSSEQLVVESTKTATADFEQKPGNWEGAGLLLFPLSLLRSSVKNVASTFVLRRPLSRLGPEHCDDQQFTNSYAWPCVPPFACKQSADFSLLLPVYTVGFGFVFVGE